MASPSCHKGSANHANDNTTYRKNTHIVYGGCKTNQQTQEGPDNSRNHEHEIHAFFQRHAVIVHEAYGSEYAGGPVKYNGRKATGEGGVIHPLSAEKIRENEGGKIQEDDRKDGRRHITVPALETIRNDGPLTYEKYQGQHHQGAAENHMIIERGVDYQTELVVQWARNETRPDFQERIY